MSIEKTASLKVVANGALHGLLEIERQALEVGPGKSRRTSTKFTTVATSRVWRFRVQEEEDKVAVREDHVAVRKGKVAVREDKVAVRKVKAANRALARFTTVATSLDPRLSRSRYLSIFRI